MLIVSYILLFLFVFSLLSVIRLLLNFIRALFSDPPKSVILDKSALIYYGISISYIITILIYYFNQ